MIRITGSSAPRPRSARSTASPSRPGRPRSSSTQWWSCAASAAAAWPPRCSEAALAVAELAHAIHGAIGFTEEYDLQLFTRRLHAWRQTAGSESYWHDVAGQALLAHTGLTLDLVRGITDVAPVA